MQAAAGPCIALVAGEASGDNLGAALIQALRARDPSLRFVGVAGPRMRALGCEPLAHAEELAVMGLTEVIAHLPRLLRLQKRLLASIEALRPQAFVGIDSPEFNLRLARKLKARGIPTVQYVSPQVWAWRQGRVRSIGAAVDLVLCILPFEADFYRDHAVRAVFVGHPLADEIPLEVDRAAARRTLGIEPGARVIALLPGSRRGEVQRLGDDFAGAARLLQDAAGNDANRPSSLIFLAPMASAEMKQMFAASIARAGVEVRWLDGQAQVALAAADAVLVASGTATLETLLSKRPMVVAYRLATLTAFLLKELGIVKVRHFSQPNLLAGHEVVPELFQRGVTPQALAAAVTRQLEDAPARASLEAEFLRIHEILRRGGAGLAADAILQLVREHAAQAPA